jgi:general secretion pathway protein J
MATGKYLTRGFTLLELLIAMTLLGFIAVIATSALHLATTASAAAEAKADVANRMRLVHGVVRRQLGQARLIQVLTSQGQSVAFEGTRQSVQFVTAPPAHLAWGGLYLVTLEVAPRDSGKALMVSYRLFVSDRPEPASAEPLEHVVLVEGIEDAEFAYFGAGSLDQRPTWQDHWERGPSGLPGLVRLRVRMHGADASAWPELVVSLHAG